jgi:hypothetical protein
MAWLYSQWYKPYQHSSFHFFNDDSEWEQMDKYSHIAATYLISRSLVKIFEWGGLDEKRSTWYSAGLAFTYITTIEVFDGFSDEWGFSWGDVACNTIGDAAMVSQQLLWHQQRIVLKGSFHHTQYSQYRPNLLGSRFPETALKDYNGLTWWVSINPYSFMPTQSKFPKWLSLAFGVGAEGMTGGFVNPTIVDGKPIPSFERYRQYYLGIDFDLTRIETKSKLLGGIFKTLNIIRLPAPTIEFNNGRKTKSYLLYF